MFIPIAFAYSLHSQLAEVPMVFVEPVEQAEFMYKMLVNLALYLGMLGILTVLPLGGSLCNQIVGLCLLLSLECLKSRCLRIIKHIPLGKHFYGSWG